MNNVCAFSCNNNMCSEASAAIFKLIAFFKVLDTVEHWRKGVGRFIFKQSACPRAYDHSKMIMTLTRSICSAIKLND